MQVMFGTPPPTKGQNTYRKHAKRICAKQWDLSYNELLSNFAVSTLQSRRLEQKLSVVSWDLLWQIAETLMGPFIIHEEDQCTTGHAQYKIQEQ